MARKNTIIVKGARVNNLKNIDVDIPRDALVVITGLSGSGKSSLAFDTIYAESSRRYMESLSSYARNFMESFGKPDVDMIRALSPAIAIDQRSVSRSPRSTVGTLTEVYDYLRVLFAKVGIPHCPRCQRVLYRKSGQEILEEILAFPSGTFLIFLAKMPQMLKKTEKEALKQAQQWGYARVRFHGQIMPIIDAVPHASDMLLSQMEVVVDRLTTDEKKPDKERLLDSVETAFKIGHGTLTLVVNETKEYWYSREYVCHDCDVHMEDLAPNIFSFNAPEGACPSCTGLGVKPELDPELVFPNAKLSLSEGAIRPWSKTNEGRTVASSRFSALSATAQRLAFSMDTPLRKLSSKHRKVVMYGEDGANQDRALFPGVLPMLDKKYRETKSEHVRAEIEKYMMVKMCPECLGKRLKPTSLAVKVAGYSIDDVASLSVTDLKQRLSEIFSGIDTYDEKKALQSLIRETIVRLDAVEKVGLGYLEITRGAETLSGGESQRIRLAIQMKSDLTGLLYVLDEPSIGLHSRDTEKLIDALQTLKENGNSLVVVEHDPAIMAAADWIVDMGPGAGREGGEVIFSGTAKQLWKSDSLTGLYLSGKIRVDVKERPLREGKKSIRILGASEHNLKNIDVSIPLETFTVVSGVSGSGKSSLVKDILSKGLSKHFYHTKVQVGKHKAIRGLHSIDKVITVTQSPIGRTPRSNAATYTGVFAPIRDLFAGVADACREGYDASHFSFNMRGGRCEVCQGGGVRKVEMYLLPDVYVKCEECCGTRYNAKTLSIEYRGMNIAQILSMTVSEARGFFCDHPMIQEKLRALDEVGLGYLLLGQSATALSGGEAQRVKLATELARKSTGKTLYILDEPTIGLHFEDIKKLLLVLDALVEKGNTVLVVEHNIDVIEHADWVIDMGPEGGAAGGSIVYEGVPSGLSQCKESFTGKYIGKDHR